MALYFITFRSVTLAQRGERLLTQKNFRVNLMRTPRWMEEQGCGYSLRVPDSAGAACVALLRQNRIPFRKVYLQRNGKTEEWPL